MDCNHWTKLRTDLCYITKMNSHDCARLYSVHALNATWMQPPPACRINDAQYLSIIGEGYGLLHSRFLSWSRLATETTPCIARSAVNTRLSLNWCCERDQALSSSFCTSTVLWIPFKMLSFSLWTWNWCYVLRQITGLGCGSQAFIICMDMDTGEEHNHIDYCRSLYIRQYLDRFRQRELPVEPASTSFPAARDEIISFFIIHGYTAAAWQEKAATAHTCANPKCQLFLKSRISRGTISRHSSTPPPCSPTWTPELNKHALGLSGVNMPIAYAISGPRLLSCGVGTGVYLRTVCACFREQQVLRGQGDSYQ